MEPPNKGHVGDNINSAVLSFIERLSSFRGSQCIKTIIKCPYFGESTIRGSIVLLLYNLECLSKLALTGNGLEILNRARCWRWSPSNV